MGLQIFLKTVGQVGDMTFCGRVLHSLEAATGTTRSPTVERHTSN